MKRSYSRIVITVIIGERYDADRFNTGTFSVVVTDIVQGCTAFVASGVIILVPRIPRNDCHDLADVNFNRS